MTIVDPKSPTRKELEIWCGGNPRILKALEAIFRLIPHELNNLDDSSSDAQLTADYAQSSANQANSTVSDLTGLSELVATAPAAINFNQDSIGLSPRYEVVHSDPIFPIYQGESCPNYYLEVM